MVRVRSARRPLVRYTISRAWRFERHRQSRSLWAAARVEPGIDPLAVAAADLDLARAFAAAHGDTLELVAFRWSGLEADLRAGRNAGKVVTHRQLLKEVWGPGSVDHTHYLRVYMGQLRHKLEADPARPHQ